MKHIHYLPLAFILPLVLSGCSSQYDHHAYHKVPYCCERTAGKGAEYYNITNIAPAAGEEERGDHMFRKSLRK